MTWLSRVSQYATWTLWVTGPWKAEGHYINQWILFTGIDFITFFAWISDLWVTSHAFSIWRLVDYNHLKKFRQLLKSEISSFRQIHNDFFQKTGNSFSIWRFVNYNHSERKISSVTEKWISSLRQIYDDFLQKAGSGLYDFSCLEQERCNSLTSYWEVKFRRFVKLTTIFSRKGEADFLSRTRTL